MTLSKQPCAVQISQTQKSVEMTIETSSDHYNLMLRLDVHSQALLTLLSNTNDLHYITSLHLFNIETPLSVISDNDKLVSVLHYMVTFCNDKRTNTQKYTVTIK